MSRSEALKEARRRWGADAYADGGPHTKQVGLLLDAKRFPSGEPCKAQAPRGEGPSWEAAFADADRRERGAR